MEFINLFQHNIIIKILSLPFIGTLLIQIFNKIRILQNLVLLVIPSFFIFELIQYYSTLSEGPLKDLDLWNFNGIFSIKFQISQIANLFLIFVGGLWLLNNIYSIGYIKVTQINYTRFTSLIFGAIGSVAMIAFSGNLFTIFLTYELLTIITYFLVSFGGSHEAITVGNRYLKTLLDNSSCFFLIAIAIIYVGTDSLNFVSDGKLEFFYIPYWLVFAALMAFIYGTAKSALFPFHFWLPEAMIAHIPVSALLHSVAVVKSGIIVILQIILFIFGLKYLDSLSKEHTILFSIPKYLAGFSVIYASILAIKKHELKKVLAYSTIAQLGYMLMIIFSFHHNMPNILIMQLIAHGVAKINLFFCAGLLYLKYKIKRIDELDGIAIKQGYCSKDFLAMISFAICAFSIIGIPPTAGSMSKFNMILYAAQNQEFFMIFIIILGTVLNCYYFLPILARIFFADYRKTQITKERNLPLTIYIPIYITALLVLALFFIRII